VGCIRLIAKQRNEADPARRWACAVAEYRMIEYRSAYAVRGTMSVNAVRAEEPLSLGGAPLGFSKLRQKLLASGADLGQVRAAPGGDLAQARFKLPHLAEQAIPRLKVECVDTGLGALLDDRGAADLSQDDCDRTFAGARVPASTSSSYQSR
jgi:hypothetical protein